MIVNRETIDAVAVQFETRLTAALAAAPPVPFEPIMDAGPANGPKLEMPIGALLTHFREFFGEYEYSDLGAWLESITPRIFFNAVRVKETDLQDDRVGLYMPIIDGMPGEANEQWSDLVIEAIYSRGWDTDYPIFDGLPLFSDSHVWPGSRQAAQANAGTGAFDEAEFYTAEAAMLRYVRPNGKLFKSRPTHILFSPELQDDIDATFNTPGGATPSKLYGRIPRANQICVPDFSALYWELCDAGHTDKPVLRRTWRDTRFRSHQDVANDDFCFRADFRGAIACPAWWRWYGSTGAGG